MTPHELARRLADYQRRVTQLAPERLEHVLRTEVVPTRPMPGVSYVVTRTGSGAHLAVFGPGARRVAPATVARLRARALQAVAGAVKT